MATYLSQPYQGSEFVSGVPLDLIVKVGMMKQMKYDQTVSDVQNQLNLVGEQDIMKDSERSYVSGRLKETVNKLNEFSGMDLSDSNVANQLKSYTTNLARDPRIYNAIADTRAIRNNMAQLNEIKEKRPGEYAQQNEALFMQGINDYLSAPEGTRYTGQAYIPYYNYDETYRKIAKDIQDNPDIRQEIDYAIMPDGTKRARSFQEVKQVTKEKIQQALLASGDQRAIRQMQIDYQSSLPNKTMVGAIDELKAQRDSYMQQAKEAKDLIAKGIQDPQQAAIAKQIVLDIEGDGDQNAGALKQIDGKIAEVRATGDPTKYYTFDKYIKDYTGGLAKSFAYQQRGKIEYDDMFKEDYKFQNDVKLEQVKGAIKLAEEQAKGKGTSADMANFTDSFRNTLFNIDDNPNREGNMDNDMAAALFDGTKNTDGSMTITLGQGETFLSLGKVMEANGIQEQSANKLRGFSILNDGYAKFLKTKEGKKIETFYGGYQQAQEMHREVDRTMEEFLQTNKGKALATQIKEQTGLDVANANDRKNIELFAASSDARELVEFGNALSKLRGQIAVRPMDGMNLFAGNDNQYYGKLQGLFTRSQLEAAIGSSGFKKLKEKGIIEDTLNEIPTSGKRDAEPLYSLPIIRKVEKDVGNAYTKYMTTLNAGDNFYMKALPGYQASFNNDWNAITTVRGLRSEDLITKGQNTLDNIAKSPDAQSADGIQKLNWLRNEYNRHKAILSSPNVSGADKVRAKKFLNDMIVNSQNLSTLATDSQAPATTATQGPRQPGQTVGEYANNPGNIKFTQNNPINRLFGGTDSGIKGTDGGTFTMFPTQQQGFQAYQAQLFGPTDGLFSSNYYQPTKTVDQAMKSWSNYRTENGRVHGYSGDIYPEIKNKQLKDLTQAERDELSSRMLKIENNVVWNQLVRSGLIKA